MIAARAPGLLRGDARRAAEELASHRGSVTMAEDALPATLPPPDLGHRRTRSGTRRPAASPRQWTARDRRNNQWLERARAGAVDLPLRSQCRHRPRHGRTGACHPHPLALIGIKQGMPTADGVDGRSATLDRRDPLGVTPRRGRAPAAERIGLSQPQGAADPARALGSTRDTAARYC